MDELLPLLPLLLLCPLGMLFMIVSMRVNERATRRRAASAGAGRPPQHGGDQPVDRTTAEERREADADIRIRLEDLEHRTDALEDAPPGAGGGTGRDAQRRGGR